VSPVPNGPNALRAYLADRIFTASEAEWAALRAPAQAEKTYRALVDMKRATEATRIQRKSALADLKSDCLSRGPGARAEYFAAEAEYLAWHRRALNFNSAVERRLAETKEVVRALRVAQSDENGRGEHALLWGAVRSLAEAIGRHRDRLDGDDATDEDRELWETLNAVAVRRGDTLTTLGDLLARGFR
jgi:DNA-binding transcriptional regulator GbsR (MarR family)